jgi:hypothetical protein
VAGCTGTLWCVGVDAHQEGQWRVFPFCPSLFPARADTLSEPTQSFQFRYTFVIRYAARRCVVPACSTFSLFCLSLALARAYVCTTPSALLHEQSGGIAAQGCLLLLARSSSVRHCILRTVEACCSAHSPCFFYFFCSSLSFAGNPLRTHTAMGKRGSVFSSEWSLARGSVDRSLVLADRSLVVLNRCCRTFLILGINLKNRLLLKVEDNRPESLMLGSEF